MLDLKTALTRKVSAVSFFTAASFHGPEQKFFVIGNHNASSVRLEN
jgi:hypothetical protein